MDHIEPDPTAYVPLSARESRPKRLRWHFKGLRQRIALRLAPWLREARFDLKAEEVRGWLRGKGERIEQLHRLGAARKSGASKDLGELIGEVNGLAVLAEVLEHAERDDA